MKILLIISLLAISNYSQQIENAEKYACSNSYKPKVREYFAKTKEFVKTQTDCRTSFIENNKLPLFDLAYFNCEWSNNGCPVSLVLPKISDSIRSLQLFGEIKVEIIIDESGKVISAQTLNGHPFLKKSASEAACKSRFSPKSFCEKPVMQKRIIRYNFIL